MNVLTPEERENLRLVSEWEAKPKVWLVEWQDWDDQSVVSAWTRRQDAEAQVEKLGNGHYLGVMLLDSELNDEPQVYMYRARIVGQDSHIVVEKTAYKQFPSSAGASVRKRQKGAKKPYEGTGWGVTREDARIRLYQELVRVSMEEKP